MLYVIHIFNPINKIKFKSYCNKVKKKQELRLKELTHCFLYKDTVNYIVQ